MSLINLHRDNKPKFTSSRNSLENQEKFINVSLVGVIHSSYLRSVRSNVVSPIQFVNLLAVCRVWSTDILSHYQLYQQ